MASVELLRKLIREEVKAVFQEELAEILKEALLVNKNTTALAEVSKPTKATIPGTLNTKQVKRVVAPDLGSGNPLTTLLAETAQAMTADDYQSINFTSDNAMGFGMMQQMETPTVHSVDDMMATAKVSSNFDAIQINAVPDFTGLMNKMKLNGEI